MLGLEDTEVKEDQARHLRGSIHDPLWRLMIRMNSMDAHPRGVANVYRKE